MCEGVRGHVRRQGAHPRDKILNVRLGRHEVSQRRAGRQRWLCGRLRLRRRRARWRRLRGATRRRAHAHIAHGYAHAMRPPTRMTLHAPATHTPRTRHTMHACHAMQVPARGATHRRAKRGPWSWQRCCATRGGSSQSRRRCPWRSSPGAGATSGQVQGWGSGWGEGQVRVSQR